MDLPREEKTGEVEELLLETLFPLALVLPRPLD